MLRHDVGIIIADRDTKSISVGYCHDVRKYNHSLCMGSSIMRMLLPIIANICINILPRQTSIESGFSGATLHPPVMCMQAQWPAFGSWKIQQSMPAADDIHTLLRLFARELRSSD